VEDIGYGETVDTPISVDGHLVIIGTARASVHVPPNAWLALRGSVFGGITIAPGGVAGVFGHCSGGINNEGEVDVYGTVRGGITGNGTTRVSAGALIDGVRGQDLDFERPARTNETALGTDVLINIDDDGSVTVIGVELTETPVTVSDQLEFRGASLAGAHVLQDAWLMVMGHFGGGIRVDAGGHLVVRGSCFGGLVNDGEADVFGVVMGGISGTGRTRVAPDAVIDGVRGRDLGWEVAPPLES
jgi:hypothetical protein